MGSSFVQLNLKLQRSDRCGTPPGWSCCASAEPCVRSSPEPEHLQFELSLPQFYSLLRTLEQVRLRAALAASHSHPLKLACRSQAQQQLGISPAGDSAR